MNPRRLLGWTQRISLWIAAAGLIYFVWRYDVQRLPTEGCSPLLRFVPGERLLLDRWVRDPAVGAALLYRSPLGEGLELGRVGERRLSDRGEPTLWIVVDNADCPRRASETFGWIPVANVEARVLMSFPW